ncbi:MAG: MinD/ParA family protein [Desulfobulbaceae bacterium]|uniref:MinD/ParA family protein n=1 Tax=Candidatus Desulfatifera sulfidica TaxID=2841691 RepID=A0A8J6N749_9BACT|nr:MinD/ParA family protein [Candidatus Desulfatifera sulfidica]
MTPNSQHDQATTLRSTNDKIELPGARSITRVHAITSGKGGVGKTALTVNTAVSLAKRGKSVLILDADLGLANVDIALGLIPPYNLNHFFSGEQELNDIVVEGPHGIKVLPAGSGIQSFIRLNSELKMRLIDGLEQLNSHFDFVLIDTEAGISDNVVYFNTAAQEILVVTTPEPTSITDAYALMKLLSTRYHEKRFNLVINQVESDEDALDVYRKLTMVAGRYLDISIDFLGSIPADKQMVQAIRKQQPLVEFDPESATSSAFADLAELLINSHPSRDPKGSVQFFWQKLLNCGGDGSP